MSSHYTYFLILLCSLAGPLLLSFDRKVAFYKKWKYLFPAMLVPALMYICWDLYFTQLGVWSFNDKLITGIKLGNLPLEEVLFFFVVPYCCMFIYECIKTYFPSIRQQAWGDVVLKITGLILLVVGCIYYDQYYTSWTFILCAVFIGIIYGRRSYFKSFDASVFLVAFAVMLIPFLIVNGFLTALPVVLYNDNENLGIRIYTIPFEDLFYGMLLILMNTVIYERIKRAG